MSVYITGDIHGNPIRLSESNFYEQKEFSGNKDENVVIILGDFGLIWNDSCETKEEKYWLDWLEEKPFTTVFVDGNHDNHPRIFEYPEKEWCGGNVHEIRQHILHLMRGEVFNIEGKKFFTFGGASSHDIQDGILDTEDDEWTSKANDLRERGKTMFRVKNISWWEEELPTEEEMKHGIDILKKNGNTVDYIITHSPSTSELYLMDCYGSYKSDVLTNYLEEIKASVDYKRHFFGHMHVDRAINDKDICLYEQIVRVL